METDRGALRLQNVESIRDVLRRAHQGAIIKIPGIQGKGRLYAGLWGGGLEQIPVGPGDPPAALCNSCE